MISFDRRMCANLNEALSREWLETNGLGGFASSTITGLNTRRYHGLLTAATKPPVGRLVLLSKLEETLVIDGRRYELSANQYPGVIQPQGYKHQIGFRLDPFPVFTYEIEGIRIEKSVFMIQGENSTVVQYEFQFPHPEKQPEGEEPSLIPTPSPILFELRPLIAFRDYHSTTHENGALNPHAQMEDRLTSVAPYGDLPRLYVGHDTGEVDATGYWYRNFEYRAEQERGLDFTEDLFSPFVLRFDLKNATRLNVIASTERREVAHVDEYRRAEILRREALKRAAGCDDELMRALVTASDQFIVARENCKTVIAGYHWFSDWGRDTMIALPGLTLVTGRADVARGVLLEFARFVSCGMLPNRFPDAGETPEYNTVDATLWFFEAVRALVEYTNDYEFVRENLYGALTEIINWHLRGTRYNIHVDEDGLLTSGEEGVQLTWMDARVDGRVITPRYGKPVEIQALWYNALCVMRQLAEAFGDEAMGMEYAKLAAKARESFNRLFWNEEAGCLYDCVNGEELDASIRPNQILSLSLTNSMLAEDKALRIIEVVERELLTPYGLRSLAPSDSRYCGRYEGSPSSRDAVYHQGAVWAWLMGPFITAYTKAHGHSEESRERAARWLENFRTHLSEAGLGQISEILDADEPHTPRGCIAQAWSVAELLRAAIEDVHGFEITSNMTRPDPDSMRVVSVAV
jgi:predicted glycogen debranching enzyme